MSINRREMLSGVAALAAGGWWEHCPGSGDHAGQALCRQGGQVLAVQSTQFAAHAKKVAAFAEQTGIKVTYVYVPFVALRERLTPRWSVAPTISIS
jgi:ABC-type glycerol-3-phosphate transport system substrate-binding protein